MTVESLRHCLVKIDHEGKEVLGSKQTPHQSVLAGSVLCGRGLCDSGGSSAAGSVTASLSPAFPEELPPGSSARRRPCSRGRGGRAGGWGWEESFRGVGTAD